MAGALGNVNQQRIIPEIFAASNFTHFDKNWLVVSNIGLLSISYMGCHPSHWLSCFSRWLKPPTIYIYILTIINHIITINIKHILIVYYQPHLSPGEIAAVGKARPRTRENGGARERSSSLGRTGERVQLGLSMAKGHSYNNHTLGTIGIQVRYVYIYRI